MAAPGVLMTRAKSHSGRLDHLTTDAGATVDGGLTEHLLSVPATELSPSSIREFARSRARRFLLGDETRSLRAALRAELNQPMRVKLADKVLYTLGVINMCATEAILLKWPHWFWLWYSLWCPLLLAWRAMTFTRKKWGYFLIDYCYFVNVLCLLHLFVWPNSSVLFELAFMSSNGPLAWAIIAWRNSLVFHDLEKITSLFIHVMPPLLMLTQRWHYASAAGGHPSQLPAYLLCGGDNSTTLAEWSHHLTSVTAIGADVSAWGMGVVRAVSERWTNSSAVGFDAGASTVLLRECDRSYWETLLLPLVFYVVWQAGYFVKTEYFDRVKLKQDPEILTSLRYLARAKAGALYELTLSVARLGRCMRGSEQFDEDTLKTKLLFMTAQLVYTLITLLPTKLMFDHYAANLFFLGIWLVAACWHGSVYYIEVFSVNYRKTFEHALSTYEAQQALVRGKVPQRAQQPSLLRTAALLQQEQQHANGEAPPGLQLQRATSSTTTTRSTSNGNGSSSGSIISGGSLSPTLEDQATAADAEGGFSFLRWVSEAGPSPSASEVSSGSNSVASEVEVAPAMLGPEDGGGHHKHE